MYIFHQRVPTRLVLGTHQQSIWVTLSWVGIQAAGAVVTLDTLDTTGIPMDTQAGEDTQDTH